MMTNPKDLHRAVDSGSSFHDAMNSPIISVVMPAFNSGRYIAEAIKSVIAQSFSRWEMLVIDDCSQDDTVGIAERYCLGDDKIHLLKNPEHLGVSKTRNRGVVEAHGEWIAFLDSDDVWVKDKLQRQIDFADAHPCAKLMFTASAFMNEAGAINEYIFHVPEKVGRRQLLRQNVISCSSVLVSREYMLRFPFIERDMVHEDFVTWLRILECEPFAYGIDEPLLIYRVTGQSKSGNKLTAARMQWNAYDEIGLRLPDKISNMIFYTINGLVKHRNMRGKSNT